MLDARIYRAALVPLMLVAIVCAFSLRDRPPPLRTTLAPDAFSAQRALADIDGFAAAYPRRRAGSPGDTALAARLAEELRSLRSYEVRTPTFRGETIDGERRLTTVIARQVGAPGRAPACGARSSRRGRTRTRWPRCSCAGPSRRRCAPRPPRRPAPRARGRRARAWPSRARRASRGRSSTPG